MISSNAGDQPLTLPTTSNSTISSSSKTIAEDSHESFQNITVVKKLNKARFPVYLIRSKTNSQIYAMKIFPFENDQAHPCYSNEIRFFHLSHPNIINSLYFEHERTTKTHRSSNMKVSYKIMEYAPYGDFASFIMKKGNSIDDRLVRTYFKQLISGLEYLHENGVCHMDIKPENLLIAEDYSLKITDFDLSHFVGDNRIISKGTQCYRAPELRKGRCINTFAADVYSAGIMLFILKTRGILPHAEDNHINGVNFAQLLHDNDPRFWEEHCHFQGQDSTFFDEDFRSLFLSMTDPDIEKRASIETIKKSQWYNGSCYNQEGFKNKMKRIFWH